MKYIERELERKFLKMNEVFKVVMVTGARQVGKSTMLRRLAERDGRTCVSMDDQQVRELAVSDPKMFFQTYKPPLLIDEAQKAPELFETIKIICDGSEEKGLFWLTGSQSRKLVKRAGDSLAGRMCVLKMYSLSTRELKGIAPDTEFDFSYEALSERSRLFPKNNIVETFEHIWRGGLPEAQGLDEEQLREYFNSYIESYLMRDAVDDNGITDTEGFRRFLRACAAFHGHILNYSDIAASAGISGVTAKAWLKVLVSMGIVYLLEPYSSNELKRMIKTPKLYFCDSGLCAWLSSWMSRDALMNGAASGHFYEGYVVGEFLRNYAYGRGKTMLSFYRDKSGREIDLIVEDGSGVHPIEIKKGSAPDKRSIKNFDILFEGEAVRGRGGIVCMAESVFPIDERSAYIPSNII